MIELKDNYQDDVLDSEKNQLRKYNMIHNDDGTVSFVDATVYSQNGDNFGAKDVNDIVARIGEVSNAENIAYDNEKSVQGAIDEVSRTIGYTVSKNQLKFPYDIKSGAIIGATQNIRGVDWLINNDGSVSCSGTSTDESNIVLWNRLDSPLKLKKGKYILSGCPQGGSADTYSLVMVKTVGSTYEIVANDFGEGAEFELTEDTNVGVLCKVWSSGVTLNDTFYPMINDAHLGKIPFEPYVGDVQTQINNVRAINLKEGATLYIYGKVGIIRFNTIRLADGDLLIDSDKAEYRPIVSASNVLRAYDTVALKMYDVMATIRENGIFNISYLASQGANYATMITNNVSEIYGSIIFVINQH